MTDNNKTELTVPEGALEAAIRTYRDCCLDLGTRSTDDAMRKALAAALPHLLAANPGAGVQVPNGWRLVPVEPTKEMQVAAFNAPFQGHPETGGPTNTGIYQAMLAAAPTPEGEQQQ